MKKEIEIKINKYIEMAQNKGFSENTIEGNVRLIYNFLESGMTLREYKDFLTETPYKKVKGKDIFRKSSSINTILKVLKAGLKNIGEAFEDVNIIKIQKQNFLENTISEKELQRIVNACDKHGLNLGLRSKTLFITLARSGCRISEVLAIEKQQIKELKKKGGLITIVGKGNKERQVIITKEVKQLLDYYIENDIYKNNSTKVFTSLQGSLSRKTAHTHLKKFAGLAKVRKDKAHLHNFRHLFCINAVASGMNIEDLAQIVGHTDINTTKIYTAKSGNQLQKLLERL